MHQTIKIHGTPCQLFTFESTAELLAEAIPACPGGKDAQENFSIQNEHFIGEYFKTWEDVQGKTNNVWQKGMDTYTKMMSDLRDTELPKPVNIRRRAVWSEDGGDEVDVDRLRRGQPFWRTTRRDHRPGPLNVTICTNLSTACSVDSSQILWRGAAAVCLAEILEQAGYRVELWAINHTSKGYRNGDGQSTGVCLKRCSDPLDTSSLINCVSGWFFRTVVFASYSLFKGSNPASNYGRPFQSLASIIPHITPDEKAFDCSEIWNHWAAVSWVRSQLEKIK